MVNEFFGLTWPGKQEALAAVHAPAGTAARMVAASPSPNSLYAGDNLDVLKQLDIAADVIYIDPPYNTGRDFVYRDNYRTRRAVYSEDHGLWHAEWLSMMLPRLHLARTKLKPSGFIFVSIGEDEVANLRKVMDEVFGEDCFAGQLVWKKAGTGKNDSKYAVVEHEYILAYAGSPSGPGFNLDTDAVTSTKYNYRDARGAYSLVRLDSKTLGYLPTLDFDITGPDGQVYRPHQPALGAKVARWRWGRAKVASNYDDLVFRRGFVYTKNYQRTGARPRSILDGERFGVTRTGRRDAEEALGIAGVFDFPKPVRLISHLIAIGGPKDAVVLDFFAGSGTTGQAVAELNKLDGGTRSYCLIQLPQPTAPGSKARQAGFSDIAEICRARLAAVSEFNYYRCEPI